MPRAGMTVRNLFMVAGVLLASAGLAACGAPEARVTGVIDGDTVEMERLGEVRLIGVDAPEKKGCYEDAATRFTREQLEGEVVQYELGEERKDRYDRTLAYLSREDEMHNRALLRGGYAKVLTIPPNDKYAALFERAEREAKNGDYGLWDHCDRESIQARRAAAQRRRERAEERRLAAAARREARQARRAAAAEARRAAAAARREQREAEDQADEDSGGGSGGGARSSGDIDCSEVSGTIPTPPGDPNNLDADGDGKACE